MHFQKMNNKFDDIRPYYDSEISPAMQRISKDDYFAVLSSFVFPSKNVDEVREMVSSISTVREFQNEIMYKANRRIIEQTITNLSYSGLENISANESYVYLSNHRDIMLDASLLQNILVDNDFDTTEITFGANLMRGQLVIDIGKSNKMFRVERPTGNMRDFYFASKHLSEYIRTAVYDRKSSVWIAQRNGRTKDGIDRTDQGIITMFRMSGKDMITSITDLNILPIAISYEWEPCDMLKAQELAASKKGPYVKKDGEDLNSIITGIMQFKGNVHIEICKPLTSDDLKQCEGMPSSDFNKYVASLIDKRICSSYKLMPNNYIAHDIVSKSSTYAEFYTQEQREAFIQHLNKANKFENFEEIKEILLGIYANPVDSYIQYMK